MAITEQDRHDMYLGFEEVFGRERAATLMEHLPPVGWADVATKRDLDHHAAMSKRDLDNLAASTKRDLDNLATMTKREIENLATKTKLDLDNLGNQLRGEWRQDLLQQTYVLITAMIGVAGVIVAGVAFVS